MVTNGTSPERICPPFTESVNGPSLLGTPEILSGTPCFYGIRVLFKNLLDYLETGEILDAFLDDFPSV